MRVIKFSYDPATRRNQHEWPEKRPAHHLKMAGRQKLHEKSTHNPWLKLSEGANSAKKEDKNCLQDGAPMLRINYSKIILVLIKLRKEVTDQYPFF